MTGPRTLREDPHRTPSTLGLFAGIGGLELGLAAAGRKAGMLCEVEPFAQSVLADRFPTAAMHDDVTTLDSASIPVSVDTIAAGFPCQDLSQAGRTAGIGGKRSGLVSNVFRLARHEGIRHLLLENVPFMLRLDKGEAMRSLVRRLNRGGFAWAYRVVDSRAFGLPQRRRRVFLIASRDFDPSRRLFQDDHGVPAKLETPADHTGFYWTEGNRGVGWTENGVPTLKVGSGVAIPSPPGIWRRSRNDIVTPGIRDAEALQGFPRGWTDAATKAGSERHRWRLVGNAVSVPAATWAAGCLYREDGPRLEGTFDLPTKVGWPTAGFGGPGQRPRGIEISEFPEYKSKSLAGLIRSPKPLSARATRGFRDRYVKSPLKQRSDFIEALNAHLKMMDEAVVRG